MICRPFLDNSNTLENFDGDGCADGEVRQDNGTWASLAACKLNLATEVYCYSLDTAAPKYYLTSHSPESCPLATDLALKAFTADTSAAAGTLAGAYDYLTDSNLRHQRCSHNSVAVVCK